MLEGFLRKIYDGFDTSKEIEPSAWREVLRIINSGAVQGFTESNYPPTHDESFLRSIRHSNEVFSAFKVHAMATKMAERLIGEDGKLRSYEEWRKAVAPIASHHVGSWLRTEYDTAVIRAHQAADWREFEHNKDIFPNLEWMPTTSPSPEAGHAAFWGKPVILPVDDPFWKEHRPGDRWNCKCSLEPTDTTVQRLNDEELAEAAKPEHRAQRGLEGDPARKGLITDKHPYYPESCAKCPFYASKGVKGWVRRHFSNRTKDCHSCPYVDKAIEEARKNDPGIYRSVETEEFGDRFKISDIADPVDLEDNKRVARAILRSFPDIEVHIRSHLQEHKVKNPELKIAGVIADNKRVETWTGITTGISTALNRQFCSAVVIDLDANLRRINLNEVSKRIDWRRKDFEDGRLQACYVVYNGQAVCINSAMSRSEIKDVLKRIKP